MHIPIAFSIDLKKQGHCKWIRENRSPQLKEHLFLVDRLVFLAGKVIPLYTTCSELDCAFRHRKTVSSVPSWDTFVELPVTEMRCSTSYMLSMHQSWA